MYDFGFILQIDVFNRTPSIPLFHDFYTVDEKSCFYRMVKAGWKLHIYTMKKCIIAISLLFPLLLAAQPKPKATEKPPTQKEIAEMMKEMSKAVDEMSPEDKKMMDSMGIKMPSMKNIPKMSDKQIAQAFEEESRIVPAKDAAAIASISKTPLTVTALPAFLSATHSRVANALQPQSKSKGEEVYQLLKLQNQSAAATGNAAAALWMMGKTELALYVMGKACMDDPSNPDNLNNYASMITMSGAEQLAIPILNVLNKQFPRNSTILNNIGQAWFGLGEITKAEQYLDSAIRIYAYHPQANYTKSFIEESKGNSKSAVDHAKRSIRNAYSHDKENRISKLKYKLTDADITWNFRMPKDALGLEKFKWPEYPMTVGQSEVMEKEWDAFRASCNNEIAGLKIKEKQLEAEATAFNEKFTKQLLRAGNQGVMMDPVPRFAPKAMVKLKYLVEGKDGHLAFNYQQKVEAVAQALLQAGEFDRKLSTELERLEHKYEDEFGEGKPNPFAAACADDTKAKNEFLRSSNTLLQQTYSDFLSFMRRKINDEVYYYQYTTWPAYFELAKVGAQIQWLSLIKDQGVQFKNKSGWCNEKKEDSLGKPFKLQAFDDVHCVYHSSLSTPVGTIRTDCSRITSTLDLKFIKLGLKQDMEKETFSDQFMNCSVEIGAGVSLGDKHLGPLKAEASIGAALAMEFDRTGMTDVIIKGAAGISVGTDVINEGSNGAGVKVGTDIKDGDAGDVGAIKDLQIEIGVKGQVSFISGKASVAGTGILDRTGK
jgi:tetratricopeptide (TPR) repeat protein